MAYAVAFVNNNASLSCVGSMFPTYAGKMFPTKVHAGKFSTNCTCGLFWGVCMECVGKFLANFLTHVDDKVNIVVKFVLL